MSDRSILLGLDGSAQTRYAAEIAWSLAKLADMQVDAQHVIDSLAAWDFLAFDIAGFIGSGPYFEAHETMLQTLTSVGQNLVDVYRQLAQQNGVPGEVHLDEGTTIREICWRAKKHDMVIMGHRSTGMASPDEDKRKLPRRSVTETLTHYCPKPLLLVQDRCRMWTHARILLGQGSVGSPLLKKCVQYIDDLSIDMSVRYLFVRDESKAEADRTAPDGLRVATDITKAVPELTDKKIEVRSVTDVNEYLRTDAEQEPDVLLVVPVTEVDGVRHTGFGITPDVIVRYLNHPAVLFWMEGTENEPVAEAGKSVSSSV